MEEFKPLGEVAKNLLNKITSERINKLCYRHIARTLTELDYFSDSEKEVIKNNFKYFANDIKVQVIGLGDLEDEKSENNYNR